MDLQKSFRIPLPWLAVAAVSMGSLIAGVVAWGTRLEGKSNFQETRLSNLETLSLKDREALYEIRESVIRIEAMLEGRRKHE